MEIKNYMEVCIQNMLDKVIGETDVCRCEKCRMDIIAIALNNLPAKYVVTTKGVLYSKLTTLEYQFDVDIITAIARAVDIVKANPRHNQ